MYPMSNYKFSKNMFCNLQFIIQFIKPTIIIRKNKFREKSNNIKSMFFLKTCFHFSENNFKTKKKLGCHRTFLHQTEFFKILRLRITRVCGVGKMRHKMTHRQTNIH